MITNPNFSDQERATRLARIQQKVWEELAKGYDPSEPVCHLCNGLGVCTVDVPFDHIASGRAFKCVCQREESLARHMKTAVNTVPTDSHGRGWADFERYPYARKALFLARQLAEGCPAVDERGVERIGLLLAGPTGCGKSTLAAIVYRAWRDADDTALWVDYLSFIKDVQRGYSDSRVDSDELVQRAKTARRLVLDDLGSKTKSDREERVRLTSEDRIEITRQIVTYRHANQLMTAFTVNLDIGELYQQFGDLIGSRLQGMCHLVEMIGPDFRTQDATQWEG